MSLVTFKAAYGREAALLGAVEVGAVIENFAGRGRAAWTCWLPPSGSWNWRRAADIAAARRALESYIADWCEAANLRPCRTATTLAPSSAVRGASAENRDGSAKNSPGER